MKLLERVFRFFHGEPPPGPPRRPVSAACPCCGRPVSFRIHAGRGGTYTRQCLACQRHVTLEVPEPRAGGYSPRPDNGDREEGRAVPQTPQTPDELQTWMTERIDGALSHSLLVQGDTRKMLQAQREFWATADAAELARLFALFQRVGP